MVGIRRQITGSRFAARAVTAALVAAALTAGACGSHRRSDAFATADGQPTARAAAGAESLTWRLRAATVLGAMDSFFDSMGAALAPGPAQRDVIVRMCATAVPRLPDLAASVVGRPADRSLEPPVREAVSGFGQYVRACAAGDDAGATEGFHFYDEGHQAAIRLITPHAGGIDLTR